MADVLRVILLVALAAAALTTCALVLNWWMEPVRRMRRALLRSLGAVPEAEALSPAEGRAAGLDFDGAQVAVLWNRGGSGLVYAFEEIEGGEIIVDGHVVARVRRGEARKALDLMAPDAEQVVLRLMFADARHPEFELALWDATLAVQTSSPGEALRLHGGDRCGVDVVGDAHVAGPLQASHHVRAHAAEADHSQVDRCRVHACKVATSRHRYGEQR